MGGVLGDAPTISMPSDDPQTEQARARVGQTFGRKWHIDALIGVGGMAAVYAATHRNGARAAIKLLHPECAANTEAKERFFREAYIANRVGHDGSVKVLDDDVTEEGEAYLVMELLEGRVVNDWVSEIGGRASSEEALNIVEQTLAILECAHAEGIVHRDLKPENLFLCSDGRLKMLDFGIARLHEGEESQTRVGYTMGTPEFMAPEQAMARWDQVDGRTDLWAVGAILFSLLSGEPVHGGESAGEVMVLAATRPAQSFARVMPDAPFALVRLIDRALEFDIARRFSSATDMRREVRALLDPKDLPHNAPATAATVVGDIAADSPFRNAQTQVGTSPVADRSDRIIDDGDIGAVSEADIQNTIEFLSRFEKMLIARVHYGPGHPELKNRLQFVLTHCEKALAASEGGLFWNITPYSFSANGETLWMPKPPLDQIPYQLFADGFRSLGILPGLTTEEFEELVRIIAIDRARAMAPEDDFVTLFWDAGLEHVVYHTVDAFDDGDQTSRLRFEQDRSAVLNLRRFDTSRLLEQSWEKCHQDSSSHQDGSRTERVLTRLNAGLPTDKESESRAAGVAAAADDLKSRSFASDALRIDDGVRRMLAAQLDIDAHITGERFIVAAADAFQATEGRTGISVTTPIRLALDHLAPATPQAAIELITALCHHVGQGLDEPIQIRLRASLTGQIVSEKTISLLLERAAKEDAEEDAEQAVFAQALESILEHLDDTYFSPVANALPLVEGTDLGDALLRYLRRTGVGHEPELGALLKDATIELGLAIVRALAAIDSPAAREAIAHASESPHAVVRIAALGHLEGVSSERLRLELRTLLEDDEPDVRVMALQAMRKHMIRAAGPFLVLRIKSAAFDKLSIHERREALMTLATLAPTRAEAVGIELLAGQRVISSAAREDTREAAAIILGRVGSSPKAREALERASTGKWRNSERVRVSASESLDEMQDRAQDTRTQASEGALS
jgi:eukaryotic-like serine/threonine-protein kinase